VCLVLEPPPRRRLERSFGRVHPRGRLEARFGFESAIGITGPQKGSLAVIRPITALS
jgi:hypothetical protein